MKRAGFLSSSTSRYPLLRNTIKDGELYISYYITANDFIDEIHDCCSSASNTDSPTDLIILMRLVHEASTP